MAAGYSFWRNVTTAVVVMLVASARGVDVAARTLEARQATGLPSLTLPPPPTLSLPTISLPSTEPSISVAGVPSALSIDAPSLSVPSIGLPSGSLSLPSVPLPSPPSSLPLPSIPLPSISLPAPPAADSTAPTSNTNVPAIVGGVVGGLAGLSLLVGGLLFWLWRRQKRRDAEETGSRDGLGLGARTPTEVAEKTMPVGGAGTPQAQFYSLSDQSTFTDAGRLPPGRTHDGATYNGTSDPYGLLQPHRGYPEL